jgi:hypothetical protein
MKREASQANASRWIASGGGDGSEKFRRRGEEEVVSWGVVLLGVVLLGGSIVGGSVLGGGRVVSVLGGVGCWCCWVLSKKNH